MNENSIELLGWYGGDEAIACSAWTSTNRDLTDEKRGRIGKLINQLWSAEPVPHKTPFEKGIVHFLVNADIATHIHLLKHRISSINAESARYKELKEDKYYLPNDWKYINVNINATFEKNKDLHWWLHLTSNKDSDWFKLLEQYTKLGNVLYHQCLDDLTTILGRKRAKESARFFKTYNSQIQADIMFNMSSFHNFLIQRTDDHAQLEVRELGLKMLQLVRSIEGNPFKYTLEAWGF